MITFEIHDKQIDVKSIWYHYREKGEVPFTLKISLDERQAIKIIERYSGLTISDPRLLSTIKKRDFTSRSMGLLWELLNLFSEKINPGDVKFEWVLNNILDLKESNGVLLIFGEASVYKGF